MRHKGVYVAEIRVDENKITVLLLQLFDLLVKIPPHFRAEHIPPGIAGYVNRGGCRQMRKLSEQVGVFLSPGKQVRHHRHGYRGKAQGEIGFHRRMNQRLFVPGDNVVAQLANNSEHLIAERTHALGKVNTAGHCGHLKMDISPGAHDNGKSTFGGDA